MTQPPGTTQREQALLDVVRILTTTALDLGAHGPTVHTRLCRSTMRDTASAVGKHATAEILDRLIEDIIPGPETPVKPPFRVV